MLRPATESPRPRPAARPRDLAVVLAWLVGTAGAFWWHVSPARLATLGDVQFAVFDPAAEPAIERWRSAHLRTAGASPPRLTLLHLGDPDCGCNRVADREVADLRRRYAASGLRVDTLVVDPKGRAQRAATPAVALLDGRDRLRYFGPVDDPAFCSSHGGPVERALQVALKGAPPPPASPTLATGCFCT